MSSTYYHVPEDLRLEPTVPHELAGNVDDVPVWRVFDENGELVAVVRDDAIGRVMVRQRREAITTTARNIYGYGMDVQRIGTGLMVIGSTGAVLAAEVVLDWMQRREKA